MIYISIYACIYAYIPIYRNFAQKGFLILNSVHIEVNRFLRLLENHNALQLPCYLFIPSTSFSRNIGEFKVNKKITVHGTINTNQLVDAVQGKIFGLLCFLLCSSEREFLSDQSIDVATCLFA